MATIKSTKKDLIRQRIILTAELEKIEAELLEIERQEKPFVANIASTSSSNSQAFATEEQARKKYSEYAQMKRYRNGLTSGVYLFKWNPDGTRTLLDELAMGRPSFKAPI